MRYHYETVRMSKIEKKKVTTPNAVKDVEKLGHSYIADRNVKCYSHLEYDLEGF